MAQRAPKPHETALGQASLILGLCAYEEALKTYQAVLLELYKVYLLLGDSGEDGLNWYGYCGNNPMSSQDPTGLNKVTDFLSGLWKQITSGSGGSGNPGNSGITPSPDPLKKIDIPNAKTNDQNQEKPIKENDHCLDSLRYAVFTNKPIIKYDDPTPTYFIS